jgi:hypothetical protein
MIRALPRFYRALLAALAAGVAAHGAGQLAPSSPFLPPSGNTAAPAAENTPIELRGIMVDGGGYRFSIFDPNRHTGTWARLNEAGHDFVIRAHDVARDIITVDYQGRVLTLPLRTSKVQVVAPPTPHVANGPPIQQSPAGSTGPVVLNPTPADEVARFNRVKEEIARRRAARGQNPPAGPLQTPR